MLEQLAHDAGCEPNGEIVEDEIPEPPDEAITKLGDLILLGDHRLLCGTAASPRTWTDCSAARRSIWSTRTRLTTSRSSPDPTTRSPRG
jgi:hypothetical protein